MSDIDNTQLIENPFEEKQRSVFYNIFFAQTISLGGFYLGYYLAIFNPIGNALLSEKFNIDYKDLDSVNGNIGLFWALGAMVGAITGGLFNKSIGRIKSIVLFELLRIAVTLCYAIPNLYVLYIVRVICGFTVGNFNCFCPLATLEILPKSLVSFGGIMFYSSISLGILLASIAGAFIETSFLVENYVYLLCAPVIVSVIRLLMLFFFYRIESPQFIVEKYAINSLNTSASDIEDDLSKNDDVSRKMIDSKPSEFVDLADSSLKMKKKHSEKLDDSLQKIYEEGTAAAVKARIIKDFVSRVGNKDVSICGLFAKKYMKKLFTAILQNYFHQFTGINFYIMYTGQTFDDIQQGTGNQINFFGSLVIFLANFPSIYFSNKFGRKFNLILGVSCMSVSYVQMILIIQFKIDIWYSIFPVMLCFAGFAVGLGGMINLYMSEFLPSVAIGLCLSWQWLCVALIGKFVPIYLTALGPIYLMYFFGFNCIAAQFFISTYVVETKNKSAQEIENSFLKN